MHMGQFDDHLDSLKVLNLQLEMISFRLVMYTTKEELHKKAEWNGKGYLSRHKLMDRLQCKLILYEFKLNSFSHISQNSFVAMVRNNQFFLHGQTNVCCIWLPSTSKNFFLFLFAMLTFIVIF